MPRKSWTLGLPLAMGTIQFERIISQESHCASRLNPRDTEEAFTCSSPTIRARISLPQWLSYKTFEILAFRAQIGWKQYLRVRNVFPDSLGTSFTHALRNISHGKLNDLKS